MRKFSGGWLGGKLGRMRGEEGFTLVEMSIVLVIIGLIVGGILKGQEIVNDGKIKIQVAQIDAMKSATGTFYDKFNYYPGDFNPTGVLTTLTTISGNEDGIVDSDTTGDTGDAESAAEGKEMDWALEQLQLANLITGVTNPSGVVYQYQGKLTNSVIYYGDFIWPTGGTAVKAVRIQATSSATLAPTPAVRTADAQSIDTKYDDGLPQNGTIFVGSKSDSTNCCDGSACAATVSTTAKYGITTGSTSAAYCVLFWQLQ